MPQPYGIHAALTTAYLPQENFMKIRQKRRMSDSIETLVARINIKLAELRLSAREASLEATGKPDAIRYIEKRRAMPSAERLAKIAVALQTTPEWLLGKNGAADRIEPREVGVSLANFSRLPRDLPVYGTALGAELDLLTTDGMQLGFEQIDVDLAQPTDYMARPLGAVGHDKMYVVTIAGHSMEPRIDAGRRLLVDGSRPARVGEDVVIQLRRPVDDGQEVYAIMVKQLVKQKAGSYLLHQYNPDVEFELPREMVHAIHPIINWEDVLGF